jgi:hypothetical protein
LPGPGQDDRIEGISDRIGLSPSCSSCHPLKNGSACPERKPICVNPRNLRTDEAL